MTLTHTDRVPERAQLEPIPFVDLAGVNAVVRDEILAAVAEVVDTNAFTNGPQVRGFEESFANYCGTRFCVGVASGLDALRIALVAAGLEPGDEVIVPANTFAATAAAIVQANGRPVVVDVSEEDYNLDPKQVEAALTQRTRFVLPVHLYGQLADMRELERLAEQHGLALIEDACQAHGAVRDGRTAGAIGLAAGFSFYPTKNLGALGDAGALVTDDDGLAERARALREHGQTKKNHHEFPGYTSRLDTIQAAALSKKLPLLTGWNEARRNAACFYNSALEGVGDLRLLPVPDGSTPVWHLYPIRSARVAELEAFLNQRGVGTGRHYPQPIHRMPAFAEYAFSGGCPVAESLAREMITLPMFPGITEAQLERVAATVQAFFDAR